MINELAKLRKEIDKELKIFFERKLSEFDGVSPLAGEMIKNIRDFTMAGGKRLRPILVYYGYLAAGGRDKKAILDASIFAEFLHSFLLIHDDIIDRDELRRGQPTVYKIYEEACKKKSKDAAHLGVSAAIMAGDLAASFAYKILAESKFLADRKNKAIQRLNVILADVILGETLDIFSGIGKPLEIKDIFKIYEYKTARYTIEGPLQIGAILAGADKKVLETLSDYAIPLGITFQIKDDILGVFGDKNLTGKSAESDIKEGKQTFLILKALELVDGKQRKVIKTALGNQNLTLAQMSKVRKIIKESGAYDYVLKDAEKLVIKSKETILKAPFMDEVKDFLNGLADYVLRREK